MNPALRVGFAGTPEFAARHLDELIAQGLAPVAVYTQPDRRAGRGKKLLPSPVKARAIAAEIPVLQPVSLKTADAQAQLDALHIDVLIVVAYGLILPQPILDSPQFGCINVHASLLPRWRGAAPIQRAIEAGDAHTGVTLMAMEAGLDTGPMLAKKMHTIAPRQTSGELHDVLADLGCDLLSSVLVDLPGHLERAQSQDDTQATYAHKIDKAEGALDWRREANALDRAIRAFNPTPGCYSAIDNERVKVWRASPLTAESAAPPGTITAADRSGVTVACGEGALRLEVVQFSGGKPVEVAAVLNSRGEQLAPGRCFAGVSGR